MPKKIVKILLALDNAEFGLLYRLLDNYINSGELPQDGALTTTQKVIFELCQAILEPLLKRRRKARAERVEEGPQIADSQKPADKQDKQSDVPLEHVRLMRRAVDRICRVVRGPEKRDRMIREKLEQYYPGLYSDIRYTPEGDVTLVV